jgi:hypothetical protein
METHIGIEIAGREYVALLDLDRPSRQNLNRRVEVRSAGKELR